MADKLKVGGKLFINVRDAKGVSAQKQKIELDDPSEILVTDSKGNIRAYQKGSRGRRLKNMSSVSLGVCSRWRLRIPATAEWRLA